MNDAFVRRYLQGKTPLGLRIAIRPMGLAPAPPIEREIVGVIRHVKISANETDDIAQVYVPLAQNTWSSAALVVRPIGGRAEALAPAIREAVARVDREVPLVAVRTLDDVARAANTRPRFRAAVVVTFAGLALLLAMVGVFGVLAYSVQQRTREFGVRIALGASAGNVLGMVLANAARVIGAGAIIGLILAAMLAQTIATFLFGVTPLDPLTFVAVVGRPGRHSRDRVCGAGDPRRARRSGGGVSMSRNGDAEDGHAGIEERTSLTSPLLKLRVTRYLRDLRYL